MHVIVSGFLFPIFILQSRLLFHKSFLLLTSLLPPSPCSSITLLYWSHLRIMLFNLVSRRRRLSWQMHYWLAITRTFLWHTHTTARCEHNREENGNSWVWVREDTLSLCCEQYVCHCISRFSLIQKKSAYLISAKAFFAFSLSSVWMYITLSFFLKNAISQKCLKGFSSSLSLMFTRTQGHCDLSQP